MLRHTSLPFAPASMLITLTQIHPSSTVRLTYACTHTSNITSPGIDTKRHKYSPLSLSPFICLFLSVICIHTHTHTYLTKQLPSTQDVAQLELTSLVLWCHTPCVSVCIFVLGICETECLVAPIRLIFNSSPIFTHTQMQEKSLPFSQHAVVPVVKGRTQTHSHKHTMKTMWHQFHCKPCDNTSLLCQSLPQVSYSGLRCVMTTRVWYVCVCSLN